jgi:hypothetical protein
MVALRHEAKLAEKIFGQKEERSSWAADRQRAARTTQRARGRDRRRSRKSSTAYDRALALLKTATSSI